MNSELQFRPLPVLPTPLPWRAYQLIEEGLRRGRKIDCFDFVPSNYEVVYRVLASLSPSRFCEWGSGIGVVTGLAECLGFKAHGIEMDPRMADASRQLLAELGFAASIETGDYLRMHYPADVYFVYCWPGQMNRVLQAFADLAPEDAELLCCYGAEDVRRLARG